MAEDKQLTVAELLARSAKERERRGSADTSAQEEEGKEVPRRRRRRSLDEGGISVAELTGSIKRVKAEPSRSRHSEAADSASSVTPAPEKTEKPADTSAAKSSSAAEKAKPKAAETPAASKTSAPSKASTADKPAEKKESPKKTAKPAAAAASGAAATAGAKADAKADSEPVKKPDTPATDDTTVIKKVETEPQAGSAPVESKATAKADKPAAKADKPAAKAEGKPAAARVDETTVMPAQPAPGKQAKKQSAAAAAPAAASASAAPAAATTDAATGEIPVVTEDARPSEAQVAQREEYDVDADDDDKLSAVSIVVLSLVGIILGAIVFKGFEVLWGRFDRIIVSILALVVTGAMVGVVHALRTARDSVSMTLAAIVGLVLTFGPLLIIVL